MGGIAAELFKDVGVGFPPLNQVLARRLMERTAIYKHAMSGGGSLNLKLLEEVLVKFSLLVVDFPEIREIDVNPLIVDENSAVAVDARIVVDPDRILLEAEPHEHLVIALYPKKYVTQWKLKDGTPVVLRPIKPEDETLFSDLFKSFSEETMRFRFFQIIKDVTHETLIRHCNIDYDREMAIVAEMQGKRKG
jgi:acetyltransferase